MRYLVCLLVGLLFGAIVASIAVNTAARRHAWPRGLMNVMQHDLGAARAAARGSQCQLPATRDAAARLRVLADALEPALLPPDAKDRVLTQYANDLRGALAAWNLDADCAQQAQALTAVGHTCDACHRDYR